MNIRRNAVRDDTSASIVVGLLDQRLEEYDQLCQSFEAIANDTNLCRRRFRLVRLAPLYNIPRAEFRKLFEMWLVERGGER
ncbi:MAG: hypothetical protein AB4050_01755 [Synechococcus sp.]